MGDLDAQEFRRQGQGGHPRPRLAGEETEAQSRMRIRKLGLSSLCLVMSLLQRE